MPMLEEKIHGQHQSLTHAEQYIVEPDPSAPLLPRKRMRQSVPEHYYQRSGFCQKLSPADTNKEKENRVDGGC